jgi:proline racemase
MNLERARNFVPPYSWMKITTIDAHTAGEPLRIITGGLPEVQGTTILDRRRFAKQHLDHLRTALMWEPRGHADMYGCIITSPVSSDADFGVIFLHNEGYSSMCGHGIIAVTKVAIETGLVPMQEPTTTVRIDAPAGLITAKAKVRDGHVESVAFQNVPSFVLALDEVIDIPGLGRIKYDLAYGGAFYAYVQAEQVGLRCTASEFRSLIEKGMMIKWAIMNTREIPHPFEKDLSFLYGTIFVAPPLASDSHSRNVCIFAEGEVDRSPTGTGVSGRMAIHFASNEVKFDEPFVIESIIGTKFIGRVVETTTFGPHAAIVPEVEGSAFITGKSEFWIDPDDPLKNGFMLR